MNQISVIAEIKNNRPQLSDYQKTKIQTAFASNNGKLLQITVSNVGNSRSGQQNKYLWGVVYRLIADHTGYTEEEVHEYMKDMFLPKKHVEIAGHEVESRKSTTDLKTDEFTSFIEQVRAFASSELQIVIPDPS